MIHFTTEEKLAIVEDATEAIYSLMTRLASSRPLEPERRKFYERRLAMWRQIVTKLNKDV